MLDGAAEGHVDRGWDSVEAAGGGAEGGDGGEEVEAAFAEGAVLLPKVALADATGAEGPIEDGGAGWPSPVTEIWASLPWWARVERKGPGWKSGGRRLRTEEVAGRERVWGVLGVELKGGGAGEG